MAYAQFKSPGVFVETNSKIRFENDPRVRFEKDDIAASIRETLDAFVGQKNTPQTQALMRAHLDHAIAESANSFGRSSKMYQLPDSSAKKYGYHECEECHNASNIISGMRDQIDELKIKLRRLENTNSNLEREIDYYKMLTEEN